MPGEDGRCCYEPRAGGAKHRGKSGQPRKAVLTPAAAASSSSGLEKPKATLEKECKKKSNYTLLYLNKKLHERNLIVCYCFLVSLQPIHVCFFCSSHCTVYSQLGLAAVF